MVRSPFFSNLLTYMFHPLLYLNIYWHFYYFFTFQIFYYYFFFFIIHVCMFLYWKEINFYLNISLGILLYSCTWICVYSCLYKYISLKYTTTMFMWSLVNSWFLSILCAASCIDNFVFICCFDSLELWPNCFFVSIFIYWLIYF